MECVKTACFSGHRPEKLPKNQKNDKNFLNVLKSILHYRIYSAVQSGYKCFITGLARGIDLWAAESVIEIKKKVPGIRLICAKPFQEHGNAFKGNDLWTLNYILANADDVVCVSDNYSKDCYRVRNCYMVDNSSLLIAVVNDYKSGTGQTISYARKKGIDISIINIGDVIQIADYVEKGSDYIFD